MTDIRIGGITPLTTIDYPGELACVLYCQGCPWHCSYCHNPELIPNTGEPRIRWDEVMHFLRRRRGLIDAVVFSGGEPTLQRDLPEAIEQVRSLGFNVGLHTAGCYPGRLQQLLPVVDWIGLDIKALDEDYANITKVEGSGTKAWRSLDAVLDNGCAYEVRTTWHPSLFSEDRLQQLQTVLTDRGVASPRVQQANLNARGSASIPTPSPY